MDTPNGILVRRCFRLLNAKAIGLTITLQDITEEEFRVMELINTEQKEYVAAEDRDATSFQENAPPETVAAVSRALLVRRF